MIKTANASLVILTYQNKLLLVLRDNKSDIASPNTWCFPGGTKLDDESFEQTAVREIKEELNLTFDSITFLITINYEDRSKYFYHALLTDDQAKGIVLTEGQRYEFFTLEEALQLPLAKSTKLFLEKHQSLLQS